MAVRFVVEGTGENLIPASSNWPNFILEVVSSTPAIDWILYSQTSVVIDTDGIDRCTCESNHHAISAMIAPVFFRAGSSVFIFH
jgi:hypothetical protein